MAHPFIRTVRQAGRSKACLSYRPKWSEVLRAKRQRENWACCGIGRSERKDALGYQGFFEVQIDPKLEEDVLWVFITDLKLVGNALRIKDEKSRCFSLDITTKKVKRQLFCL